MFSISTICRNINSLVADEEIIWALFGNFFRKVIFDGAMNYFSKWSEDVLICNQEATMIAEAPYESVIVKHELPLQLHVDQGRNLISEVERELMKLLGNR